MPSHDVAPSVQYGTYASAQHSIYVVQTLLIFGKYNNIVVNTVSLSYKRYNFIKNLVHGQR
jgi:hypothetical protein